MVTSIDRAIIPPSRESAGLAGATAQTREGALDHRGDREQCLAAGMDDYLTKPFTKQGLTAAVERWTEVPR